jgi:hypothetical protein
MSIRLAVKRSLNDEPPSAEIARKSKRPSKRPPVLLVELPKINKCIRNTDSSKIDEFGFVEVSNVFTAALLGQIKRQANINRKRNKVGAKIEEISNAYQLSVSEALSREMTNQVKNCQVVVNTMQAVFGKHGPHGSQSNYDTFVLETPKILITMPGQNPQIPHADDHCTSCILCLFHLQKDQEPTRISHYDGCKDYPTGITVTCSTCNCERMLPDADYRRGVHSTNESWSCGDCSVLNEYEFEGKMVRAFGELIGEDAPNLCDSYCGKVDTLVGDGYLGKVVVESYYTLNLFRTHSSIHSFHHIISYW